MWYPPTSPEHASESEDPTRCQHHTFFTASHIFPVFGASSVCLVRAWCVKNRCLPSSHCRDARVYGPNELQAMHVVIHNPPSLHSLCFARGQYRASRPKIHSCRPVDARQPPAPLAAHSHRGLRSSSPLREGDRSTTSRGTGGAADPVVPARSFSGSGHASTTL